MSRRLRNEGGWALATAVIVIAIMLGLGLGLLSFVDEQQRQSGAERVRESAFNLGEAALNAQVFVLSRAWPASAAGAYPAACTSGSAASSCPDPTALERSFKGADFEGASWTTTVRDDAGGDLDDDDAAGGADQAYYDEALVASRPSWDADGDGAVWVRSQARARGKTRALVALVRVEEVTESFPMNVITAGGFETTNNGRKVIVDTQGTAAQPVPLAVRCTTRARSRCLDYDPAKGQVSPDTSQIGYVGEALSAAALERLRARAKALGTYYASGCPEKLSGALVFIESGDCAYSSGSKSSGNSAAAPGVLVVATGTVSFTGSLTYYGVIYGANLQRSADAVVSLGGAATIQGAVAVDGAGRVLAGSNKENVIYDGRAIAGLKSYGSAGIVQTTWRELRGGY